MNHLLRPRNWEPACGTERSAASANNMAVLTGVLGCRPLRRTVQVRLGFDLGFRISDLGFLNTIDDIELNSADFAIKFLIRNPHSTIVDPVARPSSRSRDSNS